MQSFALLSITRGSHINHYWNKGISDAMAGALPFSWSWRSLTLYITRPASKENLMLGSGCIRVVCPSYVIVSGVSTYV